jgi:endonuclease/exonuclease/phosphatase family metal-dependent hydrolase
MLRAMHGLLVALLVTLAAHSAHAEAAEPVTVLSYNTHGLAAWIAGDDPAARFPRIAELANTYDLALLQEDFVHHERLRASARQPLIERGGASRFGSLCPVCSGDGLTLLANLPARRLAEIARVAYSTCAGWLGGANDCLATKGFVRARIAFPGVGAIDFVNTHLDAGGSAADRDARATQLEELRAHLQASSAGRALVVAGDLNLHFDEPLDRGLLDDFIEALGLRDSGAAASAGSAWERLDYILVRSGEQVAVDVLEAGEAIEFTGPAGPLSDHPALFVRLGVRRR